MTITLDSETKCLEYLAWARWGEGKAVCPKCESQKTYKCKNNRFRCGGCKKDFTAKVGTIFENSNLPLRKWYMAVNTLKCEPEISVRRMSQLINVTPNCASSILHKASVLNSLFKEKISQIT